MGGGQPAGRSSSLAAPEDVHRQPQEPGQAAGLHESEVARERPQVGGQRLEHRDQQGAAGSGPEDRPQHGGAIHGRRAFQLADGRRPGGDDEHLAVTGVRGGLCGQCRGGRGRQQGVRRGLQHGCEWSGADAQKPASGITGIGEGRVHRRVGPGSGGSHDRHGSVLTAVSEHEAGGGGVVGPFVIHRQQLDRADGKAGDHQPGGEEGQRAAGGGQQRSEHEREAGPRGDQVAHVPDAGSQEL